jgi:hypothetical protein
MDEFHHLMTFFLNATLVHFDYIFAKRLLSKTLSFADLQVVIIHLCDLNRGLDKIPKKEKKCSLSSRDRSFILSPTNSRSNPFFQQQP